MKTRWKLRIGVVVLALLGILLVLWPNNRARANAAKICRELKEQGFKLDFSEFHLSTTPDMRTRAARLAEAGQVFRELIPYRDLDLMRPAASNSAVVVWKEPVWQTDYADDLWLVLRTNLNINRDLFLRARDAALTGPLRFEPPAGPSPNFQFSQLSGVRLFALALAASVVVELHDGHRSTALTNLLALTRLSTAWDVGPSEASSIVRFGCITLAERATWQTLQSESWSDAELAVLQREWESADFFSELPQTAAFARAQAIAMSRTERARPPSPPPPLRQILSDLASSPSSGWMELTASWREARYRSYGTYEEEAAAMLYFRDRELTLREAVSKNSWAEMRGVPGVTNHSTQSGLDAKFAGLTSMRGGQGSPGNFIWQGLPLLARAAEAETRRRLAETALALQRRRAREHGYPESLTELAPGYLKSVPLDFMDGRALRYRPTVDGAAFVLYSVGLDCADDGGELRRESASANRAGPGPPPGGRGFGFGRPEGPDIVWPLAEGKGLQDSPIRGSVNNASNK